MWGRATAGIVPGFFLATAIVGLVSWMLPGPWQSTLVAGGLAFFPVWIGVFCLGFQFRNGVRAWLGYTVLATLGMGTLAVARHLHWMQ